MTVPLPLFELIEADGDVNQITDIRLTLCLLNWRANKAHCLLNWSLCDICSCPPASAQRKDMRIKLSSQKSKTLNSSFLNLWKNSESTDKYFQTETTGLFWERWPQRISHFCNHKFPRCAIQTCTIWLCTLPHKHVICFISFTTIECHYLFHGCGEIYFPCVGS